MPKNYGTGVVVGKFYPFHLGHKYLIEEAAKQCTVLYVIVTEEQDEAFSAYERAEWIEKEFARSDDIVLTEVTENDLPNEPEAWAKRTREIVPYVNAVFTSEDYGPPWAKALGVEHVHVDKDRYRFPTSGTQIRADLLDNWDWLAPSTKAGMAPRVVVIGAESTGSTTLAKGLAEHYKTPWVPEFGREWWDAIWFVKGDSGTQYDFDRIVDGQNRMASELAVQANKVLICDTDNLATVVFEERYLGAASDRTKMFASFTTPALYIHTGTDIPWVNDGMRESEEEREWMSSKMLYLAVKSGAPTLEVTGTHEERMNRAISAIDNVIQERLGSPLPITEVV